MTNFRDLKPCTGAIKVELSPCEMLRAAFVGILRQIANLGDNLTSTGNLSPDRDWQCHVEGAMGELAFAKAFDLYFPGTVNRHIDETWTDVGGFEVKTRSDHRCELLVETSDRNIGERWALVTGVNGKYEIRGWVVPGPHLEKGRPGVEFGVLKQGRRPVWQLSQDLLTQFTGDETFPFED